MTTLDIDDLLKKAEEKLQEASKTLELLQAEAIQEAREWERRKVAKERAISAAKLDVLRYADACKQLRALDAWVPEVAKALEEPSRPFHRPSMVLVKPVSIDVLGLSSPTAKALAALSIHSVEELRKLGETSLKSLLPPEQAQEVLYSLQRRFPARDD